MVLVVDGIHTYYGKSHILRGVSVEVEEDEVVCLLGRNGVGKTTLLRSIMGLTPPRTGKIYYKDKEITSLPPYKIAYLGIGFVSEERRIFSDLTVDENLKVAKKKGTDGEERWNIEEVYNLFPNLEEAKRLEGKNLSGGEQQMLAIARTLLGNPEMLLLDEPSEGLAPLIINKVQELISKLSKGGLPILLSEQNVKFATEVSDRTYLIDIGKIVYQGSVEELQKNEEIKQKYLAL